MKKTSNESGYILKKCSHTRVNGSEEDSTKMVCEAPPLKTLNDLFIVTVFLPFAAFNCHSILFLGKSFN